MSNEMTQTTGTHVSIRAWVVPDQNHQRSSDRAPFDVALAKTTDSVKASCGRSNEIECSIETEGHMIPDTMGALYAFKAKCTKGLKGCGANACNLALRFAESAEELQITREKHGLDFTDVQTFHPES